MRTKLLLLVLALAGGWGATAMAQTPEAAPALATTLKFPPGVARNITDVMVGSDNTLDETIQLLAKNANLKFKYANELTPGGLLAPVLNAAVGQVKFEQITEFEALVRLLQKNDLVIGNPPDSNEVVIGTRDTRLNPIAPLGGELDASTADSEFDAFADMNTEMSLRTAIVLLSRYSKQSVLLDPELNLGKDIFIGTNNAIHLPSITNVTVNLSTMVGRSAKERLSAVLAIHGLTMQLDEGSQIYVVRYKDPTIKEPLVPNVLLLRHGNPTNITELLTQTYPHARVRADSRTASLLVVATQKDFESISNLVSQLDTPTQQVLIEARFLETLQNPRSVKGIDWTDTLKGNRVTYGNGSLGGAETAANPYQVGTQNSGTSSSPTTTPNGRPGPNVTTSTSSDNTSIVRTSDPSKPAFSLSQSGFNPSTAFLNADGVNVVLSMLNSDSDTRTLATPRAVTLDNMQTKLEVTRSIPIFDQSEATGAAGVTVASSKPSYTNVGTILIVTPHISGTNVSMRVQPEISRVEAVPSRKVVAGKINEADIFAFNKIDTHVTVPSGNTLVMGGLISDSSTKLTSKVPILGDIPLLGKLFRHEATDRTKANLIIFLTPTIIFDEDFQPYRTEFLNTKMPEHSRIQEDNSTTTKPVPLSKKEREKQKAAAQENRDIKAEKFLDQQ
jgi:type II secretory pathway component GspD/PulD (secretin)